MPDSNKKVSTQTATSPLRAKKYSAFTKYPSLVDYTYPLRFFGSKIKIKNKSDNREFNYYTLIKLCIYTTYIYKKNAHNTHKLKTTSNRK